MCCISISVHYSVWFYRKEGEDDQITSFPLLLSFSSRCLIASVNVHLLSKMFHLCLPSAPIGGTVAVCVHSLCA